MFGHPKSSRSALRCCAPVLRCPCSAWERLGRAEEPDVDHQGGALYIYNYNNILYTYIITHIYREIWIACGKGQGIMFPLKAGFPQIPGPDVGPLLGGLQRGKKVKAQVHREDV